VLAPLQATLLAGGLLLTTAGADVRSWISDAVTPKTEPARSVALPGGGRLLTAGRDGLFVRTSDGPRRIFGDVGEATWSPRGLFVVATRGIELIAVSPRGDRRWSLHHRAAIHHPRWAPSGYQIAYLSGGSVFLVDGDGSNDARLAAADGAAPAWRPVQGSSQLAYANGRSVVLRDTIDRRVLFSTRVAHRPLALSWSKDGQRLLVVERDRIQLLNQFGARLRTSHAPRGTRNVTGTFAPAGRDWTLVRTQGASSRLMLVSGQDTLKVLELAGRVDGVTYSPSGRWLALGVGRSVWLVRPGYHAGLRGVQTVPAHGHLMDWAP
jgi:Tol biopolymer transport system component